MTPGFWQGKRVLVTGHTGFKGGWLALWLKSLGSELSGLSLWTPDAPCLYEVADIASLGDTVEADVRDLGQLRRVFGRFKPDIVFHLAAQSLVRESYRKPLETFSTNIIGTVNVMEAARLEESVRVVVNVTTDKCYENRELNGRFREDEPLGGLDPYSSSKACSELVTSAYRQSFFQPEQRETNRVGIATARAGNVIGGGDWAKERLVPDIIRALALQQSPNIRNSLAVRPWQHVLEPLNGYLLLAEALWSSPEELSEAWNFGPDEDDERPVSWVVDQLCSRWDGSRHWEPVNPGSMHEAHYLRLDSSKARDRLDWKPKLGLDLSLDWVVDWYKAFEAGENMNRFTRDQISQFQNLTSS